MRSSLSQVDEEPADRWRNILNGAALEQAVAFADQAQTVDFDRPKVADAVSADFLRLRARRVEAMLEQLSFQQSSMGSQDGDGQQVIHLAEQAQQLITQKRRLDAALAGRV